MTGAVHLPTTGSMYSQQPQQVPVPSGQTPQLAFYAKARGAFSPGKQGGNCRRGSGQGKASPSASVTPALGSQRQC